VKFGVQALVGEQLGKYRLTEVLGAGGMAVVYGAEDPDGQPMAVKML